MLTGVPSKAYHPRRVNNCGVKDGPDIAEVVAEGCTRSLVESSGARNLKALLRLENIIRCSPLAIWAPLGVECS